MRLFVCVFQYYEMSYGLNVEMHKQVSFCYQPRFFRIFSRLTKRLHNHFCVLKYDLLQDIYIPAAPAPAEGRGACSPTEKLPPPWASAWEGLLPVLRMHTLLERSYSTRTNMKRTNFSRQFDKLDLNFQTAYTLRSYPHPVRNHSPHQNCLKPYFSALQQNLANTKTTDSLNLFCQLTNARTAKNYLGSCLNGSEPTH